jgi:hypothetical protein
MVNLHGIISFDLTTVTAEDIHAQTSGNHLPFIAVLVALVLGGSVRLVVQLSPLRSSLCYVWSTGACLAGGHVDPLFEIGDRRRVFAEGIKGLGSRVHQGLTLLVDPCLGTLEVALTGRGSRAVGVRSGRPSECVVRSVISVSRGAKQAVEPSPVDTTPGFDQTVQVGWRRAFWGLVGQAQDVSRFRSSGSGWSGRGVRVVEAASRKREARWWRRRRGRARHR